MSSARRKIFARKWASFLLALLTLLPLRIPAQTSELPAAQPAVAPVAEADTPHDSAEKVSPLKPRFRLETVPVGKSGELLTVFGRLEGLGRAASAETSEVPLVSVLRDTLGDTDPENDRLRYVWALTYTRPSAFQRVASAVPFLYTRVGSKGEADDTPPPVIDLSATERDVWNRFAWIGFQTLLFNPYGVIAKSAASTYDRNQRAYRQSHVVRALSILSLYDEEATGRRAFSRQEMDEVRARLMLTDKIFGGIVDDAYLESYFRNQSVAWRDTRGHNWELLRQRAEAEGLYFEPLKLPDGEPTHAVLWVAREDLAKNVGRKFNGRFLNFASPWGDRDLVNWEGYTATRYYDAENRPASADAEGARAVHLIPLAVYGLEHPKIPIILVDFRDGGNPKRREVSHRLFEDVTRNVLSLSKFGDLQYFLGRTAFDFFTGRRGMDVNQPTRLRSYAQLKLLLSLDPAVDPKFREEVRSRLERVSMNPLENGLDDEVRLAREQYAALLGYAQRPGGLAAKLERDRRAELVPVEHGRATRTFFRVSNVLSLGLYKHRESAETGVVHERLDAERRLAFHRRFLREVSKSSPLVEVAGNIEDVRRSLRFVAEHGSKADAKTSAAAAKIFARTEDEETRRLALSCLYRINNETAKNELLRIYLSPEVSQDYRALSADYLRRAVREEQRIKPADARAIVSAIGQ